MDEAGRNKLWTDYNKSKSADIREQLILEYAPLVKLVAGRLSMYLGFNVEYDDLVGYGIFGLIDAIDKFDLMKDVKFETYASLRIRGAILDQIRKMDWIPRTIRQRQKKIEAAIREIEKDGGHVATDAEIAAKMEISEDEYQNWQNQMKVTGVVSLNEFMDQGADIPEDSNNRSSSFVKPEEAVEKEELKKMLAESLEL
jgi:RNA polymerase sigma factor for flagellar operon FliA